MKKQYFSPDQDGFYGAYYPNSTSSKKANILRGMAAIQPIYHIFGKLPLAKKITQKILVFERDSVDLEENA